MKKMKRLTKKQAKILFIADFILGLFHAYGAYWFHKRDLRIGFWLTIALMVSITLFDTWIDTLREKDGIYKPSTRTYSCPIHSSGLGAGSPSVHSRAHNKKGFLGESLKCL